MPNPTRTTIQCPNCKQPINAVVETLMDVGQDPQAKARLLSGHVNSVQCPNCSAVASVATVLLYHDPVKELLISYAPMEMGLTKDAQDKMIGSLMNELTARIPKEQFKGYLFSPKAAFTMQGMIDQVLQADGVTPEMIEAQRLRMRLVERIVAASPEELPQLVTENDDRIDAQFFQMMTLAAQNLVQGGRPDAAERVLTIQSMVAELSSYGQQLIEQSRIQEETVNEVAKAVNVIGAQASRTDFLNLAIDYAESDQHLQALVGLVRPAFDNQFFQELTSVISGALGDQRIALETLRNRLIELTAMIDQQAQMAMQEAVQTLQALLSSTDPVEAIRDNLQLIDDTFMAVLAANIQEAEKQANIQASARLKGLYNQIINVLQESMAPELKFINDLLTAPSDQEAVQLIASQAPSFGERILDVMDGVTQELAARGNQSLNQRLAMLRTEIARVVAG